MSTCGAELARNAMSWKFAQQIEKQIKRGKLVWRYLPEPTTPAYDPQPPAHERPPLAPADQLARARRAGRPRRASCSHDLRFAWPRLATEPTDPLENGRSRE